MKNYRLGNTITVKWTIMTATGTAYNLNAGNLELYAVVPNHAIKVDDFSVSGNVVTWTFHGSNQKFTGPYTLTLIENRGQSTMMTVDYCNAFGLVRWSCQAGWDESADVNSNLSLTSEIFTHQIALSKEVQDAIDSFLKKGYLFAGIATPDTDPGTPDQNVFWIASTPGNYTHFRSDMTIKTNSLHVIYCRNNYWTIDVIYSLLTFERSNRGNWMGGNINDSGEDILMVANQDNFYKNFKINKYVSIAPKEEVFIISNIPNGSVLNVFEYDINFQFLQKDTPEIVGNRAVCDSSVLNENARYLRATISGENDFKDIANSTVSIQTKRVKDVVYVPRNIESNYSYFFSFEVGAPYIPVQSDEASTDYRGLNGRYYDNGYIITPPNYCRKGRPVPLIIFVHGTNGYWFNETGIQSYGEYLRFLSYNGYAVADCSGLSNLYGMSYSNNDKINSKISPISISCYISLYKFLIHNFNIDPNGVYILGKSSGGLLTSWFAQTDVLPVIAAAGLAPSLDLYGSDMRYGCSSTNQVKFWLSLFGYTNIDENIEASTTRYLLTQNELTYIRSQINKCQGFDPIAMNSDLDYSQYIELANNTPDGNISGYTRPLYADNDDMVALVNAAKKYHMKPFKIWHAVDDTNVLITTSEWFVQMAQRGGQMCYLRKFPAGCGGHHAVDNASNAPKVNYKTKFGGTVNIPVAYAEVSEWFDSFGYSIC